MNYFELQRLDWIFEMLQIYGFINREHLVRKFRISIPQASKDINKYIKLHEGTLEYNMTTKRYEKK